MAEPATPSESTEPETAGNAPPCPEKRWGKVHPDLWPEDLHASLRWTGIDNVTHRLVPERSLPGATSERVRSAYTDIKRVSGHVGGEAHGGAVYGEMGRANMQRLIDLMVRVTDLDPDSVFLDIGSGLGKPSIHAAAAVGCFSLGVEYMATRFNLSVANLKRLCRPAGDRRGQGALHELGQPRVMFCCEDAWLMGSLEPTTHLFMFDVGMPPPLMRHVAAIFMASSTTEYLVCYRPPNAALELGFDVLLLASLTCRLIGSAEAHRAFLYRKRTAEPGRGQANALVLVRRMRLAAAEGAMSGALSDLAPAYKAAMARSKGGGREKEGEEGEEGESEGGGRAGGHSAGRAGQPGGSARGNHSDVQAGSGGRAGKLLTGSRKETSLSSSSSSAAARARGSSSQSSGDVARAADDARWQELVQKPCLQSARLELRAERLARLQHGNEEANVDASPLHSGPPRCFLRMLDVLARGWDGYYAALDQDLSCWAVDRVLSSEQGVAGRVAVGPADVGERGRDGAPQQHSRTATLRRRTDVAAARLRVMMGRALPEEALRAQQRHEERQRKAEEEEAKANIAAATVLVRQALVQELATGSAPRAFAAACLMPNECAPLPLPLRRRTMPAEAAPRRRSSSRRRPSKRRRHEDDDDEQGDGEADQQVFHAAPSCPWDALAGTVPSALVDPMAGLRARATDPSDPAAACAMELVLCTGEAMPAARARRAAALDRILSPAGFVIADFGLPDVPGLKRTKMRGMRQRDMAKQVRAVMAAEPYPGDPRPPYSRGFQSNSAKAKRARRGGGPAQLHRNPSDELLRAVDLLLLPSTMATPSQRSAAIEVMLDAVAPISCGGVTSRDPPAPEGWQRERASSMDVADEPEAATWMPASWVEADREQALAAEQQCNAARSAAGGSCAGGGTAAPAGADVPAPDGRDDATSDSPVTSGNGALVVPAAKA